MKTLINLHTMKTKLMITALCIFAGMQVYAQSIFDKFEDNDEVTTVVVSQKMFEMLSKIDSNDSEAKEFMEIAKNLNGLRIFTTENKAVAQKMKSDMQSYLKTASLAELMRVKDKGSNVKFFVKQGRDADHVSELLMFIEDGADSKSNTVLMTLTGDIDLRKIGTLTKNMNLPAELNDVKK